MTVQNPARYQDFDGAPAAGTALCPAADIAPGAAHVATFRTGTLLFEMFVLRPPDGGDLVAYVNDCPHAGTPLDWEPGRFLSKDRALIQCATHGARFRIQDGLCVHGPCLGARLVPVPIATRDGTVFIADG